MSEPAHQFTEAEVKAMTPEQIVAANRAGSSTLSSASFLPSRYLPSVTLRSVRRQPVKVGRRDAIDERRAALRR